MSRTKSMEKVKLTRFEDLFGGVKEDTIIEISVEKPGQNRITSNIKVKQSDLELLAELKNLAGK